VAMHKGTAQHSIDLNDVHVSAFSNPRDDLDNRSFNAAPL
jgi:hypothetical protein